MKMDPELFNSFLHLLWYKEHNVCVACEVSLSLQCIPCFMCDEVRYCGILCFLKNREQHRNVCNAVLNSRGKMFLLPEIYFTKTIDLLFKAKMLDANGDYSSPSVIFEAYLIKNPAVFAQNMTSKLIGLGAETFQKTNPFGRTSILECFINRYLHKVNEDNNVKSKCEPNVFQDYASRSCDGNSCLESSLRNGHFGMLNYARASEAAGPSSNEERGQSFGDGWWKGNSAVRKQTTSKSKSDSDNTNTNKNNCNISRTSHESIHKENNKSFGIPSKNDSVNSDQSRNSDSHSTGHSSRDHGAVDSETKQLDSWGSGWWCQNDKKPSSKKSTEANQSKQTHATTKTKSNSSIDHTTNKSNDRKTKRTANSETKTNSESEAFGSGWWKSSNRKTKRTANSETKTNSDSEAFGSGWWKKPKPASNEKKATSMNSNTQTAANKIPSTNKLSLENVYSPVVNTCLDVSVHEPKVTHEHIVRFQTVASRIASGVIQKEALHGRILVMGLVHIPGLWRASLGGSCISLVAEIVGKYPSFMLGILIRDNLGKTAPVLLKTTETDYYEVPGMPLSVQMSDCLKPGNFLILRAVKWELLPDGKMGIIMRDIKLVDFIFYQALLM